MDNPFAYSNYVTGDAFCNRNREISEILKYINSSQNILLYSHRRYGKSSLIQQVFQKIKNEEARLKVAYAISLSRPDNVFVNTGSSEDQQFIIDLSYKKGEESKLAIDGHTIHYDLAAEQGVS